MDTQFTLTRPETIMQELLNEALRLWLFSPLITRLLILLLGPCLPYPKEDHA